MAHKLLLADDSVTIQRVIELTFADEDIQVVAVGDGKKAIASIQADRPDIVLADVGMPERDGYEVAAFIKTNSELAHIPVLLLTGAFEPIDEARARAVGCDGVLVKPFEPQMVINRVKDLLAGRRPAGAGPRVRLRRPRARWRPPRPPVRRTAPRRSLRERLAGLSRTTSTGSTPHSPPLRDRPRLRRLRPPRRCPLCRVLRRPSSIHRVSRGRNRGWPIPRCRKASRSGTRT